MADNNVQLNQNKIKQCSQAITTRPVELENEIWFKKIFLKWDWVAKYFLNQILFSSPNSGE